MRRAAVVLALASAAGAQDIEAIRQVPCITWSAASQTTYTVQRAPDPGGPWETLRHVYWPTTGLASWADTEPRPGGCYRVAALTGSTAAGFLEDFEDEGGWADHPAGWWTNWTPAGAWVGEGCHATSAPARARSPVRCIGFNGSMQRLRLPFAGCVTQVVMYYRGVQDTMYEQCLIRLIGYDGYDWYQVGQVKGIYKASYTGHVWAIQTPDLWQVLKVEVVSLLNPIYIDDLQVWTQ